MNLWLKCVKQKTKLGSYQKMVIVVLAFNIIFLDAERDTFLEREFEASMHSFYGVTLFCYSIWNIRLNLSLDLSMLINDTEFCDYRIVKDDSISFKFSKFPCVFSSSNVYRIVLFSNGNTSSLRYTFTRCWTTSTFF